MGGSMFKAKQKRSKMITSVYLDKRAEEVEEVEETRKSNAYYFGVVLFALVGIPVSFMLLWNWLMPAIFGLPSIGYFKSIGLLAMSLFLFRR